jgi:hypothetical protein
MGRRKAARLHALAAAQGGLEARAALPDDAAIAAVVGAARCARSTLSSIEPRRARVERWATATYKGS